MATSDPIADLLTRLRNAGQARHRFVDIPWSKMKEAIVQVLEAKGFVKSYRKKLEGTVGFIRVYLKYDSKRRPAMTHIKRISTPGVRAYARASELAPVHGGLGICVVSTSQGVITADEARKKGIGGEILCHVSNV